MSLWVQRTSIGGGTLVHYSSQADGTGWCIAPMGFSSAGNIVATVYKPDNHVTGPVLSVNTWTHIATTYSQKNGLTLYVNGASVGSTGAQPNDASGAVVILTLGNSLSGSSGCGFQSITPGTFSGYLDEFRVYSRELSATEVFALFVDKTCTDGLMNGDETDIDCGGSCFKCTVGQNCTLPKDCNNVQCINDICAIPTCTDGIKNQDEADVDCGGSTCAKRCSLEQGCLSNTDCTTDNCDTTAKKCSGAWVKIASDSAMVAYCTGLGSELSATLSACESYCLSMSGCNAVDWHAGGSSGCTIRQCSYYPPKYASHSGWEVWAITTGTSITTDLVWVKVASEGLMGDVNCAEVGSDKSVIWSDCESACLALSSCNTIDFSYGGTQCTYRHCTTYPPKYQSVSGWDVWAITTGTSTTTNTTTTTTVNPFLVVYTNL
ncbi:unnamed protein product [Adineta steineri]|uniref:LamG-like jellyroll fold domain-containing protein n=1 Tax=Adineta steineri TaxID=433720 RepID=A0A819YV48_9BILA|nr:unnamed protein product [Adineta steineri]